MKQKKIFILLPDGVGLRNFAFTSFVEIGKNMGWEVVFWNQTPFDLTELGYKELKLQGAPRSLTDLLKRAKINAELNHFEKKFNDSVYQEYKFPPSRAGLKAKVKNGIVSLLTSAYKGEKGLENLREHLKISERKSRFYERCKEVLEKEQPDIVFCTNQRPVNAIAPLTAAQDLEVPAATFIFSWDNLPKATMVVESDYYFVWSEYMKQELLDYYPNIQNSQIKTTGTPQFEPHFKEELRVSKEEFYKQYKLDINKKYLCFSGDDFTTSPHDEIYLKDVAEAVEKLNAGGDKLGIIFRRCPTDFSKRYEEVLEKYKKVIVPIAPMWEKQGEGWNSVLPTREDLKLQVNVINHTFMVINIGSSMVFDYQTSGKPCAFLNYNPEVIVLKKDTTTIYDYIHFRSMPSENAVLWINNKEEIAGKILEVLKSGVPGTVEEAGKWFETINKQPPEAASERIWESIEKISRTCI